jgi:peptide/nickel transport system permease protein
MISVTMIRLSPGFGLDEAQLDPRLGEHGQRAMRAAHDGERNPAWFYVTYLRQIASGDLGVSQSLGRPIRELLADRIPETAGLMVAGMAGAWALAALFAIPPVAWRLRKLAALSAVCSGISASLPAAGIALLLFRWGGSPAWIIVLILFPKLYQFMRHILIDSYRKPHVLQAEAKGIGCWRILIFHALLPARPQLIALTAVTLNMAFGAAVAAEAVCDLPGLGQLAWKAALARDLPVLVTVTMLVTLMTQVSSLVADACTPARRSHA